MTEKIIRDALMLWATIDPIGTMALFAALTSTVAARERSRIALRATVFSLIILICCIVVGQPILDGMGIQMISLQLAGGIILFLFGLQMIFGTTSEHSSGQPEPGHDIAVFPLAIPSIASPGAIAAAIVLTDNDLFSVPEQIFTGVVLTCVLLATYVLMLLAGQILRLIGENGAAILVRIMGMILAALSVQLVMEALGVERWLHPPH